MFFRQAIYFEAVDVVYLFIAAVEVFVIVLVLSLTIRRVFRISKEEFDLPEHMIDALREVFGFRSPPHFDLLIPLIALVVGIFLLGLGEGPRSVVLGIGALTFAIVTVCRALPVWKKMRWLQILIHSEAQHLVTLVFPLMLFLCFAVLLAAGKTLWQDSLPHYRWIPSILTKSNGHIMLYYGWSLFAGTMFAAAFRVVAFNAGYARMRYALAAEHWLLIFVAAFGVIALLDNFFASRGVFAFSAFFLSFIVTDLAVAWKSQRNENLSLNVVDLGTLLGIEPILVKRQDIKKKLCSDLKRGHLLAAYFRLKFHRILNKLIGRKAEPDKDLLKLKAGLYFRLGRYRKVLRIAERGNNRLRARHEFSETLVSFKALAQFRLGQGHEAEHTLFAARKEFPANYYYMHHLAYIFWQRADLSAARDWSYKAAAGLEGQVKIPTLALQARIICDLALDKYPGNSSEFPGQIAEARSLAEEALLLKTSVQKPKAIYLGDQLDFVLGYVCLLERQYKKALDIFSGCEWRSSHRGSRFQIGLLHMIGTRSYHTAIAQFEWILNTLRLRAKWQEFFHNAGKIEYKDHFYRLVENNLKRAYEAKRRGVCFNEEIIFYQLHFGELVPPAAEVKSSAEEQNCVEMRHRIFKKFDPFPFRYSFSE